MKIFKLASLLVALAAATASYGKTFDEVTAEARAELKAAEKELADLRSSIADKKIPISRRLTQLESEVQSLRKEYDEKVSVVENKEYSLDSLRKSVKLRNDENVYLKNTMNAYIKQFGTRIHAAELQEYKGTADAAEQILETNASDAEKLAEQLKVVRASLGRVKEIMGGAMVDGAALTSAGLEVNGKFVLAGPFAFFGDGGENVGIAESEHTNIAAPLIINRGMPKEVLSAISDLTDDGKGLMPIDATEGDALKLVLVQETLVEHIKKGGATMIPLLGMAFFALLITILKFFEINSVKSPKAGTLQRILDSLNSGNKQQALEAANSVDGPFGDLLVAGVEHADQEKELLEEVLYERLLAAQPKLERFIAFIALTAAAAPLLGLLGTVTGMIQTFKAITVFGTGDPATLADGISVALITTEYGLIVAIPCLLAQALLSRIAKGKLGEMEQAAVAFVNGLRTK